MTGKSIKIFITGDSPRSLKKITLFNWSGYAYYGKREQIKDLKHRGEDSHSPGIYFLFDKENGKDSKLYIGETEDFLNRIQNPDHSKRDWWKHFIVFHAKDNSLNKAHVKYLEHAFWKISKETFEIELDNADKAISKPTLSEEDEADMKIFKENILYILEGLEISFFRQKPSEESINRGDEYYIATSDKDHPAYMVKTEESYILKTGSFLKGEAQNSFVKHNSGYYNKWKDLVESQKVKEINNEYVQLLEDIELSSPSLCGSLVKGRSCNGNTTWKNKNTGKTLQEETEEGTL